MVSTTMAPRVRSVRRPAQPRATRPSLEGLEDRLLLFATSGDSWVNPSRITYSFVPDGTSVGGTPTNMYSALSALGITAAQYQLQVEKAAAVWEAVANINLALVPDNGAPIGVSGNQQDDPRFGDIRIGGYAQGVFGQLAFAFLPPPADGGTDAGDIFFNSSQSWQVNGSAYDLETVAIHELGHALGMSHSAITTADMYAYYNSSKQQLTSDDTAGIQSIYGARTASTPANNSFATAIDLSSSLNAAGQLTLGNLAVSGPNTDVKYYYVTAPASSSGTLTVTMQSANLSSLCPQLVVYSSARRILANVSAPNSYGATDVATITGATPGTGFYIRVQAAQLDAGGNGAFGLQVNFSSTPLAPVAPPNTIVLEQPDAGGGTSAMQSDKIAPKGPLSAVGQALQGVQSDAGGDTITVGTLTGSADAMTASLGMQRFVQRKLAIQEARLLAQHQTGAGMTGHAAIVGHWQARGRHHA